MSDDPPESKRQKRRDDAEELMMTFPFGGTKRVPVTYNSTSGISRDMAAKAIKSDLFVRWYQRCLDSSKISIHSVEIQSVDMFGSRYDV